MELGAQWYLPCLQPGMVQGPVPGPVQGVMQSQPVASLSHSPATPSQKEQQPSQTR